MRGVPDSGMTAAQASRRAAGRLRAAGVENSARESDRLLSLVLNVPRASLILDPDRRLDAGACVRLDALLDRRIGGEPLQHIEGNVQFREIVVASDGRALVPRFETEELVERVTRWARDRSRGGGPLQEREPSGPPLLRVLDIGTGSGVIALSLLAEGTAARAVGIDVSLEALSLARENRRLVGMENRFDLLPCDVDPYRSIAERPGFDVIVSNPPYVRADEIDGLPTDVRDHDPRAALDGGPDGLAVIRRIVNGARERLFPGGGLFLETGIDQGEAVVDLLVRAGPWRDIAVQQDLAGRDRFVTAEC